MLSATCHCGAVRLHVPRRPRRLTMCNCSSCRRRGALWAYYRLGTVEVVGHPAHTVDYVHGDRTLRTIRCRHCGCITHWEPLDPRRHRRVGVNMRNFEPSLLGPMKLRLLDGADTWTSSEWAA